jgi:predicted kinase
MRERYCIAFAGVPGSSKTPIACYLCEQFNLPIFSGDAIRVEVKEDKGWFDVPEFDRRREARLRMLVSNGHSFVHDSSIDRQWHTFETTLEQNGYRLFVISLDLSRPFLESLYKAKAYDMSELSRYINDHQQFLEQHRDRVGLHITDTEFLNRLDLSAQAIKHWRKTEGQ